MTNIQGIADADLTSSTALAAEYALKLQAVRDGFAALNWAVVNGELDGMLMDALTSVEVRPEVFGQIMMEMLEEPDGLQPSVKQLLVLVAAHMGPDWIETLRRAVAFMDKVESFR